MGGSDQLTSSHTLARMSDGQLETDARSGRTWLLVSVIAAVVVLAAAITFAVGAGIGTDKRRADAAAFKSPSTPRMVTVTGSMRLPLAPAWKRGTACQGGIAYPDVQTGRQMTITDAGGKVLAATELAIGQVVDSAKYPGMSTDCELPFQTAVPAGVGPYGFTIGRHGTTRFDESQLGNVKMSLG